MSGSRLPEFKGTGIFQIKIADFNNTNGANPIYGKLIEIGFTEGINEVSSTNGVNVYPNPSNGKFTVEVKGEELRVNSTIEVYNMTGQQIYQSALNSNSTQINLGNASDGIYIYRVFTETGNLVSDGKFVIQK